uniref:Transposase n=1 Tax=Quercus lobata TaxID=97700 RepID=A0A7N2LF77_QUELO
MSRVRSYSNSNANLRFYAELSKSGDRQVLEYVSLESGGDDIGEVEIDKHAKNLLDSCNGLLLFRKPSTRQYDVFNPTTKESLTIPYSCDIPMDYNDHIDNSDEDHSYDVENDEYDDEELYDLVVAGCHHTRHIRLGESVGICLMILGQGLCYRMVQERFQHSGKTIHRHFHRVMKHLNIISMDILKPSDPTLSVVPRHIQKNPLYMPHFQNCIGAIDGTPIQVVVRDNKKASYYNRKGVTSFNVMVASDFDLLFTFVMAGWEGATHDIHIS